MNVLTRLLMIWVVLVGTGGALSAEPLVSIRIGEVEFQVSDELWDVSQSTAGGDAILKCLSPECHGKGQIALLSARSPAAPCSIQEADEDAPDGGQVQSTMLPASAPNGLDFVLTEIDLGCRNYVPPQIRACAIHNGRSYHLSTITREGCHSSIWDIPRDALNDLLRSARVTP